MSAGVAGAFGAKRKERPWIPSDELMADLPRLMNVASLPGMSISVIENGTVAWTRSVGVTNAETREPVREDTLFQAASLSKPVCAYVVLRIADEKLLDLDRPLVQYRRPDYLSNHADVDVITARDVLRHSTGFPNWRSRPDEKLTPAFKPGNRWRYSGEGFFWLQLVIEEVTGESFETVVRSRLFRPAKMNGSTFGWSADHANRSVDGHRGPGEGEGGIPFQYRREMGGRLLRVAAQWGKPIESWKYEDMLRAFPEAKAVPGDKPLPDYIAKSPVENLKLADNLFPNAASSLLTTASEYARFLSLVMKRPRRAQWEISDSARTGMLSRQIEVKANAIYWGLGWGLEPSESGTLLFHGGNNAGIFKSFTLADPVRRRAIAIFTNGGGGPGVYQRIIRNATGHDPLEFIR